MTVTTRFRGFTLIESVMVIAILGILSVFLVVYLIDLESDAKQNATTSVAKALGVASSTNYALSRSGSIYAISISNCTQVANALPVSQPLPSGYTIISLTIAAQSTAICTVTDGTKTATFIGHGI